MTKTLTIRGVTPDLTSRLDELSRAEGRSVNAVVLRILSDALGSNERAQRLRRAATWSEQDLADFDDALARQRVVDERAWA